MNHRLFSAAVAIAMTVAAPATVQAQSFSALARQDLQSIHEQLRDNHPAAVVPGAASEGYRRWLETGLADALAKAGQANSAHSHNYLLRYYATGFRDPGIRIPPTFELLGPYYATGWPGFTTGWRDGKYVVTYVQAGMRGVPQVGDVVTECNAAPIEEFARRRLDLWEGDLNTEAGRIQSAPYLLWNRNNPFTGGVPQTCKFQRGRGRPRDFTLKIEFGTPAQYEAAVRSTLFMPSASPLAIETVDGRPWVHAHSLADDAGWDAFNAQLAGQVDQIRGPQGFVLDLRGADGASLNATAKGYALANRIWTPEYTVSRQPEAGVLTHRASAGNRQWYSDTLGRMVADPVFSAEYPAIVEEARTTLAAYDAAIAAGQRSFTVTGRAPIADTGAPNPVQGKVIVLVDAGCSGGCLDVLDLMARLPNVQIAGTVTGTDSIFIEPTVARLPSNYADIQYGHKAWTTRQRGLEPYRPAGALAYTGNPADEVAVRAFVAGLFGG
ncbi:hypothetical protein GVN24_32145 [Rhizobium sp. CRIBSB]|nr:hypothetical protein [Rhizobium sp. CRIBSB]